MGFYLSEAQHIKKFCMDKKIEDIIETLKKEITSLKNIIDSKEAEITAYQSTQTALYADVKRLKVVDEEHQKLNGKLRLEVSELKLEKVKAVEEAKKEADSLMINKCLKYEDEIKEVKKDNKKLAKEIEDLKKEAKDLLNYP